MSTVLAVLKRLEEAFINENIESPRVNAEVILSKVLNFNRMQLYLNYDRPVSKVELNKIREIYRRRIKREPLQLLTEEINFYSYKFVVKKGVFIPRQETEILIDVFLKEIKDEKKENLVILDLGSGSGVIGVTIAKLLPKVSILSTDLSFEALELAKENANLHKVENKIFFIQANWLSAFKEGSFDYIISNPPYIPTSQIKYLVPEVKNYDPLLSLDGGEDGIKYIRLIYEEGDKYLSYGGKIIFEIDSNQKEIVEEFSLKKYSTRIFKDLNGDFRVVLATKKET